MGFPCFNGWQPHFYKGLQTFEFSNLVMSIVFFAWVDCWVEDESDAGRLPSCVIL